MGLKIYDKSSMSHQSLFVGNDYEQNIDTSGLSEHVCGSIPKLTFLEF